MLFFYRPLLVSALLYHSRTPNKDTPLLRMTSLDTVVDESTLCPPCEDTHKPIAQYRRPATATLSQSEVMMLRGNIIAQDELRTLINNILVRQQATLELQLSCNDLGDAGALALADMLKLDRRLKTFRLAFNQISGTGVKAVADALVNNETLESLDLSSASIDRTAAIALASMLESNHALQRLTLELCSIGERELIIVADALGKNSALKVLDIGLCDVKNSGLHALIQALETNHTLEAVILRGNQNLDPGLIRELNRLLIRNQYLNGVPNLEPEASVSSRLCY
ncbi:hypothetical protein [Legionella sp. CNM-4043-24]|uniref:hypothetical protein n=1 Tax=Legionella sp. CNM-4043-24 TaxID=3421646 RepID=UPI00403B15CA